MCNHARRSPAAASKGWRVAPYFSSPDCNSFCEVTLGVAPGVVVSFGLDCCPCDPRGAAQPSVRALGSDAMVPAHPGAYEGLDGANYLTTSRWCVLRHGISRARRSRFGQPDSRMVLRRSRRASRCGVRSRAELPGIVRHAVPPHRVQGPRQPARKRDHRDPFAAPLRDRQRPRPQRGSLEGLGAQNLPRGFDQEPPHASVARFRDPSELAFLARAAFARHPPRKASSSCAE